MIRSTFAVLTLLVALASPRSAHAQLPIPSLSIVAGTSHYHLDGSGTTPFGAARLDIPLLSLVAEGSLGFMHPTENTGAHTYMIPEAQLQYQLLPVLVRPYIGVGGGMFKSITGPDPQRNDFTLSAAAGVRASLPIIGFGFRAEARVRSVGSGFSAGAAEFTLGVSF